MNTETIQLSNGYTAEIALEDGPQNPWQVFDCEPPAWVYSGSSFTAYGEPPTISELYWKLPVELFTDENRHKVTSALDIENADREGYSDDAEGWKEALADYLPSKPDHYGGQKEYFSAMAGVCNLLEIPYLFRDSLGYCQGNWAECFFMATTEWLEKTGVEKENAPAQLEAALKLWSAWAWGDVYGVIKITRPDGTEVEDASCWGFYGTDHAESGLLEHCTDTVNYDIEQCAKEETEAFRAACADIATV